MRLTHTSELNDLPSVCCRSKGGVPTLATARSQVLWSAHQITSRASYDIAHHFLLVFWLCYLLTILLNHTTTKNVIVLIIFLTELTIVRILMQAVQSLS